MELSIQAHHDYFSMDMNYFKKNKFVKFECRNKRFCMVFLEHGTMEIHWDDKKKSIEKGPVLLCINEKELFSINTSEPADIIVLHPHILNSAFDFENIRNDTEKFSVSEQQDCYFLTPFLKRTKKANGIYHPNIFLAKRIASLVHQFEHEITLQDTDFWPCKSRSCLIEILSLILNTKEEQEIDSNGKLISEVQSYLISHIGEKVTILDLTKKFHKNRTDLSGLFLTETGQTIMEYLKEQRMEFAAALVRGTGLPFTTIMERVGFCQYTYFSRSFKEYTGKSPREYRKNFKMETDEKSSR